MATPETTPGKSRTISIRPNPPIIPPPKKAEAGPAQIEPEILDPSVPATNRGADLAEGIAAIRKAEGVAMRAASAPSEVITEQERPSWLPEGATAVRAAGEPCDVSLDDEYADAPPERKRAFAESLALLQENERRAWRESQGIILR